MSKTETAIGPRHAGQYPHLTPVQQARQRDRQRAHRIKFVKYVLMGLMTMDEAARALNTSPATLDRWRRDLLADDRQDTDDLRKLDLARKHRRQDQ